MSNSNLKIIFFGTSDFSVLILGQLISAGYGVTAVITAPDQPTGRKKILTAPPAKLAALELGIPVFQPASLKKDESFFEQFQSLNPDICIVASYSKIIPQRYLDIPPKGFLNIHPSLLPKYRGPSPIQTAILNGEIETGVTVMQVDVEMDHGFILLQLSLAIGPHETYQELHDRLANEGAQLLLAAIKNWDTLEPREQDHYRATVTKMFERADGKIDWSKPTKEIYDQIRALNPEPGTWTTWQEKILNIKKATLNDAKLELVTIQLEGKKEIPFTDFLRGHPDFDISKLK